MGYSSSHSFDFDEWVELASTDQDSFEQRRNAMIEDLITQAKEPIRRRLRGLQFRIDLERHRARTPMQACLKISSMMWDSLLDDNGLKAALESLSRADSDFPKYQFSAKVIPFRCTSKK